MLNEKVPPLIVSSFCLNMFVSLSSCEQMLGLVIPYSYQIVEEKQDRKRGYGASHREGDEIRQRVYNFTKNKPCTDQVHKLCS
jgi:hypothetical protein